MKADNEVTMKRIKMMEATGKDISFCCKWIEQKKIIIKMILTFGDREIHGY